jgi:hypothetical protein
MHMNLADVCSASGVRQAALALPNNPAQARHVLVTSKSLT